jgi:hypothetical protein
MLDRLLRRPRIEATLAGGGATTKEFARELRVGGTLTLRNLGAPTTLSDFELIVIGGGTRRIPLETPAALAGGVTLGADEERAYDLGWTVTLSAPLRAPDGDLTVRCRDARGRQWVFVFPVPFTVTG